ncbi:MAG: tRNA uridine-5-carboxymethylaminomethyl(34) synthesis GTPase MnmE [Rhodospirillaceae bacterium]|nr:tRNA uridine-5-carboxymethylaminomethyl(34) synthesis GTPase MnmE [Rhodospirillaceae bacterium]
MAGDTIVAPASGPPPSAICVIRISGPATREALYQLCGTQLRPRRLVRVTLREMERAVPLDEGLAVYFPGPDSFTGEDVGELHVHGSRAVIDGVIDELCRLPDVRPSEPGEFSRRAFANGKLDLVQAEGIADLVAAETRLQRIQAIRQLQGGLSELYDSWRSRAIACLAEAEASLDFIDEADVGSVALDPAKPRLLARDIAAHLDDDQRGERLREGFRVAVLGPPNSGKSSLVNLLARREAAIVSSTAGTTRDIIEVHLSLGGWPITLADTAGIREAGDSIEREGIRRALNWAKQADVTVFLGDLSTDEESCVASTPARSLQVWNKSDLRSPARDPRVTNDDVVISCRTGKGIDELLEALRAAVAAVGGHPEDGLALTRVRHRQALKRAAEALRRAAQVETMELAAEELRAAVHALGRITGRVDVEDVLDRVFSSFCIGK